jgi:hypothetical protein
MKVKTSELQGAALDWAVAKVRGFLEPMHDEPRPRVVVHTDNFGTFVWFNPQDYGRYGPEDFAPSTDWTLGGPIIEREWLDITPWPNDSREEMRWHCQQHDSANDCANYGPTPLVAAMRCYVASQLGDEIEIPEELQ